MTGLITKMKHLFHIFITNSPNKIIFIIEDDSILKKFKESPRVIDRGTSAHFCVSDQYLISKVLRIK